MTMQAQSGSFSLQQKYSASEGVVLLTGIQALVRALQTRRRLDEQHGVDTGGFVSGYRGSPLGGLDKELWAQAEQLEAQRIHFQPGVNEDLAATAVWGSQQVGLHAGAAADGVFGLWYGKTPGLDRSCDAIRHANSWGTSANGGVVLVVGDDPAAKSSSLATQSEFALQNMQVPILAPSDVQEVLDFTVLGWEMSRHSGLWVALKAIADHMDSSATVEVGLSRFRKVPLPTAEDAQIRADDTPVAQEQRQLDVKIPAAVEFARAAKLNRWVTEQHNAHGTRRRLGLICAGKAYRDVREACAQFGWYGTSDIRDAGIEILKLGMTWPLDDKLVRRFADSVDMVLVIEEKRAFVEPQVKEALYSFAGQRFVAVLGKRNAQGKPLLGSTGILSVNDIAHHLSDLLELQPPVALELARRTREQTAEIHAPARQQRTPLFCAGCPHNTSTRVPQGSRGTAGIGCHYMVQWMDRDTDSCTHMGGEGVTWVGESLFSNEPHVFANLGDGTYFHSGTLAIRQAVAANVNITYKVLFNDAVAMTGGQPTDGELTVPRLVAQVRAEGVAEVVIVSDDPDRHHDLRSQGIAVYHRRELDDVQRRLRDVAGVSVLIYQQTCATELRRRRKRGLVKDDKPRVVINAAVCEGCGDCSVQSNCVAVEPKETAFGLKRQINQTSCNKDLSCATGFCPAFVEVPGGLRRTAQLALEVDEIRSSVPEPVVAQDTANILISGVGGTGIVTLSALLAAAAQIEGKQVRTLDMTGLAQKGGAVFSHVRIARADQPLHVARIPEGGASLLVACDLISAASDEAMELLSRQTRAVVNSHVTPTADFVLSQSHDVKMRTRLGHIRKLAAEVSTYAAEDHIESFLGDAQQANVMLLGYAYQLGGIPLALESVEQALQVNGVAVQRYLLAFHLGRVAAHDESLLPTTQVETSSGREISGEQMTVEALIEHRADFLTAYDGADLAERFRAVIARVAQAEQQVRPGAEQLTRAVAETYAQLLAVKDEYEVARLYLDPSFELALQRFGGPGKVRYLLAPPLLGTRKRRFGPWMRHVFRVLAAVKGLRNTWLDPFAHTSERKQADFMRRHFEDVLDSLLAGLTLQNLVLAIRIVRNAGRVRGFGHVKVGHMQRAMEEERGLWQEFTTPPEPVRVFDPLAERVA